MKYRTKFFLQSAKRITEHVQLFNSHLARHRLTFIRQIRNQNRVQRTIVKAIFWQRFKQCQMSLINRSVDIAYHHQSARVALPHLHIVLFTDYIVQYRQRL